MVEMNTGSLVTEGGEITGIVTERDYLRRVTSRGAERETRRLDHVLAADRRCPRRRSTSAWR